jgi:hypothetical protein
MAWKAWIDGHDYDLEDLVRLFDSGETRVVKEGDGYYLASSIIDDHLPSTSFYDAAQIALGLVNGIGRTHDSSFNPVRLTGRYTDGDKTHHVLSVEGATMRMRAGVVTVTVPGQSVEPPPPPPGPALVALAVRHPDVSDALILLGKPEPLNWIELYKVYEVVRDSVKPTPLDRSGLATRDEISAFTGSANRPDVSGPDARHARMGGGPPQRQMSLGEARDFISRLAKAWMDTLN